MAPAEKLLPMEALSRLSNLSFIARWVVEGFISGLHSSPFHGFSVEFSEYRQYVPGDDLRYFDWKAFGRSDKYYIKKFHSETNLKAHILLDCSASMGYGSGTVNKLRFGACLAAALAYLLIRQQDAVGLVTFSDRILEYIPPGCSPSHQRSIMNALEAVESADTTDMASTLHRMAGSIKRRGLIILISDLFENPERIIHGLRHFRFRHHEIIVFQILDFAERNFPFDSLSDFRDMETGERLQVLPAAYRDAYLGKIEEHIRHIRRELSEYKIDYQEVITSEPFDAYLARYLFKRARMG